MLVSGVDGPTVFDLRCEVREALVDYLQRAHPESLPRVRVDGAAAVRRGGEDDQTSVGDQPDAVRLEARPVESESESTRTQGLFTGSAEAAERARGFTRPHRAGSTPSREPTARGSDFQQPPQRDQPEHHDRRAQRHRGQPAAVVRADEPADQ